MKNLIYVCIAIVLFGCSQTKVENDIITGVTITGKIENPKSDFAVFLVKKGNERFKDTVHLDSAGQFLIFIELKEETNAWFVHGGPVEYEGITMFLSERTSMFFVPGDSIELTLDPEEFDETISYKGKGSAINNYLAKKYLYEEKMQVPAKEMYALDPIAFISKVDSTKSVLSTHLREYVKQNPNASKKLIATEEAEILYNWATYIIRYPKTHKGNIGRDSFNLGSGYENYLTELNLDDSSLTENATYKEFINEYLKHEVERAIEQDSTLIRTNNGVLGVKTKMVTELFKTPALSNYLLYNCMYQHIKNKGTKGIEKILARFEKICTNDEYKTKVRESYDLWKNLVEGNEAPEFSYPDINGDTISLSDLRGKYVYIDIWATWCGPCRRELPHLEKLQEEYADKNIVFLSVSIDEKEEAWRKMVEEKHMKGVQLIAAQGWDAAICESYVIKSIPRFLLIGKDGKIIDAKAERPSRGIEETLKDLEGIDS